MTDKQPTQEQVIAWAHKAEIGDSHGHIIRHELAHLERFAALAYEAGRKDENDAAIEDARTVGGNVGAEIEKLIRTRREQ